VSISKAHQLAGAPNPAKTEQIHLVMSGIRRALGRAQTQKAPAVTDVIRAMLDTLGTGPAGQRDRALLLIGFAGAFRRSELVALDIGDLAFVPSGVVITLRRSKTDQEGQGRKIGIPMGLFPATCPVRALRAWIEAAELVSGALFRPIDRHGNIKPDRLTAHAVARIVKRAAFKAGLDESAFSGHSLRAGLATAAAAAGASDRVIMKQTGHKSRTMVDRYVRSAELFKDNAGGIVGL
jgi:integrase